MLKPWSELKAEAAAQRLRRLNVEVARLTNGFTLWYRGEVTFYPDVQTLIVGIAYIIGGEDAIPSNPVSPEEAGLLYDDEQIPLPIDTEPLLNLDADLSYIHDQIVEYIKRITEREDNENVDNEAVMWVNEVFRKFGYGTYQNYRYRQEDIMPELKQRLLNELTKFDTRHKI